MAIVDFIIVRSYCYLQDNLETSDVTLISGLHPDKDSVT